MLEKAVSLATAARVPLAFHLAESREEMQLLRSGTGPFREAFEELGTCDPRLFRPGGRPLDYLRTLAKAHRALVIHGNYLDDEEITFLARHAGRMAVVYVIGLSILSGSHIPICQRFQELRREHDLEDTLWLVGGVIPARDRPALEDLGVDAAFSVGTPPQSIIDYIVEKVP